MSKGVPGCTTRMCNLSPVIMEYLHCRQLSTRLFQRNYVESKYTEALHANVSGMPLDFKLSRSQLI